ncbi:MAG TPA: hypothetical protein IGQ15_06240 [Thermosynechococcus sp. M98_K2018_005]|uniref:hypothetical protein n=1 Tax=Thermosynechococcus sp. M98_K2018_005 TaxID=2747811 RepID=UPI001A064FB0|nr:hypothetical protein [Thermosynechococcus sp. M98_K2018_005]HIK35275.1 hypothetical protein [Thermosynechococcus sp. M98_K2018_005]
MPLFVNLGQVDEEATAVDSLIDPAILNALPSRYRRAADQAVIWLIRTDVWAGK